MFEDPFIRWHDKELPAFARYFAWLVNCFAFVSFRKCIVITEGFRFTVVLSKIFSFNRISLVMLVADESPYFLVTKYYSRFSWLVNHWGYNRYDGFVCIGQMEAELVRAVVTKTNKRTFIRSTVNGIASSAVFKLSKVSYNPDSKRIVFIGNGPARWREYYKGVDLLIKSVAELIDKGFNIVLEIAGEWDSDLLDRCNVSSIAKKRISFVGYIKDIDQFFEDASLYVHVGRGDAWPISIMEAMAAGIVPVVSEWTGAKQCVAEVSTELIVSVNVADITQRIRWFFELSREDRVSLSKKCREVAGMYPEGEAIESFKTTCESLIVAM